MSFLQVIGASGISVFDLSRSQVHAEYKYFNITDVYMSYLTHGDSLHLSERAITFSYPKTAMRGHERYHEALNSDYVFHGAWSDSGKKPEFVRLATSIFDNNTTRITNGVTHESSPRFRVALSLGHDAVGFVERTLFYLSDKISYKDLRVDIFTE